MIFSHLERENDDGGACVGYIATGYMGFGNWRVVFRCSPEHLQQYFPLIHLAASPVFAIDAIHGEFTFLLFGNSVDKLRQPRSDAYSAAQVLLNKQQISCGRGLSTLLPNIAMLNKTKSMESQ